MDGGIVDSNDSSSRQTPGEDTGGTDTRKKDPDISRYIHTHTKWYIYIYTQMHVVSESGSLSTCVVGNLGTAPAGITAGGFFLHQLSAKAPGCEGRMLLAASFNSHGGVSRGIKNWFQLCDSTKDNGNHSANSENQSAAGRLLLQHGWQGRTKRVSRTTVCVLQWDRSKDGKQQWGRN